MEPCGRKKYRSRRALAEALERYFGTIGRTVDATERYDTGEKDLSGHDVFEERKILNDYGEAIRYREYAIPPTVGGLCEFLGIGLKEWAELCEGKTSPDLSDLARGAVDKMHTWSEQQLLTRKDVKGIIFSLQNSYGYKARQEVELGPKAAGAMGGPMMSTSEKAALLIMLQRAVLPGPADRGEAPDESDSGGADGP